jgi:hypothetical protein
MTRLVWLWLLSILALASVATPANAQGAKPLRKCPTDAVISGTLCMDKYEASVWRVPDPTGINGGLVKKIQSGKATTDDLAAGGATQLGTLLDDYAPCADNGQNCTNDIYALSLAGVSPSGSVTWFQAQIACKNSRKRLPTNAEWQAAVAGTPDPGGDNGTTDCNVDSVYTRIPSGSRSSCVSADGVFDMVGNVTEWVADWTPGSAGCGAWGPATSPTGDNQCFAGVSSVGEPGAVLRGGSFQSGNGGEPGPLAIDGSGYPSDSSTNYGFRCAR